MPASQKRCRVEFALAHFFQGQLRGQSAMVRSVRQAFIARFKKANEFERGCPERRGGRRALCLRNPLISRQSGVRGFVLRTMADCPRSWAPKLGPPKLGPHSIGILWLRA